MRDCCLYLRVSTDKQDNASSKKFLIDWCAKNNWNIVKTFEEKKSGKMLVKDRPELTKLFQYVEVNKNVKAVIVIELSRIGRMSLDIQVAINEKLTSKGVNFIAVQSNIQTLDEHGQKNEASSWTLYILAKVSEDELLSIKKRTARGRKIRAEKGFWIGSHSHYPYGFVLKEGKLLITDDKNKLDAIKLIFTMYSENNSLAQISRVLNAKDIKGHLGGHFFQTTLTAILTNERFKNIGIIDPVLFDKCQYIKQNLINKRSINVKYDYLLRGDKYECGVCGRNLKHKDHPHHKTKKVVFCKNAGHIHLGYESIINSLYFSIRFRNYFENFVNKLSENDGFNTKIKEFTEKFNDNIKNIEVLENKRKKLVKTIAFSDLKEDDFENEFTEIKNGIVLLTKENIFLSTEIKRYEKMNVNRSNNDELVRSIKTDTTRSKQLLNEVVKMIVFYPTDYYFSGHVQKCTVLRLITNFSDDKYIDWMINNKNEYVLLLPGEYDFVNRVLLEKDFEGRVKTIPDLFNLNE